MQSERIGTRPIYTTDSLRGFGLCLPTYRVGEGGPVLLRQTAQHFLPLWVFEHSQCPEAMDELAAT